MIELAANYGGGVFSLGLKSDILCDQTRLVLEGTLSSNTQFYFPTRYGSQSSWLLEWLSQIMGALLCCYSTGIARWSIHAVLVQSLAALNSLVLDCEWILPPLLDLQDGVGGCCLRIWRVRSFLSCLVREWSLLGLWMYLSAKSLETTSLAEESVVQAHSIGVKPRTSPIEFGLKVCFCMVGFLFSAKLALPVGYGWATFLQLCLLTSAHSAAIAKVSKLREHTFAWNSKILRCVTPMASMAYDIHSISDDVRLLIVVVRCSRGVMGQCSG